MKNIYKGDIKTISISKLEINNGKISTLEYETPVIKKDGLFYIGALGAMISFDYETRLPDEVEAKAYVVESIEQRKEPEKKPYPGCFFINSSTLEYYSSLSNHQFKLMKKQYKELNKSLKKKK